MSWFCEICPRFTSYLCVVTVLVITASLAIHYNLYVSGHREVDQQIQPSAGAHLNPRYFSVLKLDP